MANCLKRPQGVAARKNIVRRQSQVIADPKKCPQCSGYFDAKLNGHIYLDGIPDRARDHACDYREFGQPTIKLEVPEITAMHRILDNNLFEGWPLSQIPEVQRIAQRRGVKPEMVEGYDDGGHVLLLNSSIPIKFEQYWKRATHTILRDAHHKLVLNLTYFAGDRVEVLLLVDGRPQPFSYWTKTTAQIRAIIENNGWQKVESLAVATAGGA